MKSYEKPIIDVMLTLNEISDEYLQSIPEALQLAGRFQDTPPEREGARRRLKIRVREHIRRLHANADRMTHHLARYQQLLHVAPPRWRASMRKCINVGSEKAAQARWCAVVVHNILERNALLETNRPSQLLH